MSDFQAYRKLYGNLAFEVPHYVKSYRFTDNGGVEVVYANGSKIGLYPSIYHKDRKLTLSDV